MTIDLVHGEHVDPLPKLVVAVNFAMDDANLSRWRTDVITSAYSASQIASSLALYIMWVPIDHIYKQGPSVYGYGFWQGASPETMCATFSGGDAKFWIQHPEECTRQIDDRVTGMAITIYGVILFVVLYMWITAVLTRAVYVNPVLDALNRSVNPMFNSDRRVEMSAMSNNVIDNDKQALCNGSTQCMTLQTHKHENMEIGKDIPTRSGSGWYRDQPPTHREIDLFLLLISSQRALSSTISSPLQISGHDETHHMRRHRAIKSSKRSRRTAPIPKLRYSSKEAKLASLSSSDSSSPYSSSSSPPPSRLSNFRSQRIREHINLHSSSSSSLSSEGD
jgi:hypothetical protein